MKNKLVSLALSAAIAAPLCAAFASVSPAKAHAAASYPAQMEYLDRGAVAVKSGGGVYLSWRLLGTENYDTAFDVYRDGTKIATVTDSTNYTDTAVGTSYAVVPSSESASSGKAVTVWDEQYITIPLDRPAGGTSLDGDEYTYSPNDVTPADVDGDGEYELILKWEPSNSFDSGKDAKHNGNVYIDCYEMDGTKLWRIDMGININAGAHFTQLAAYDFDLDGKAELAMKTAPGTKDGNGNYVSAASDIDAIKAADNTADYRHSENGTNDTGGRVLSGDEYYTVFQGDTGEALDTVYYPHPRGTISEWGDDWGNRSERYLTGVAYLDGETPSMLAWRGYYAKTTVTAYNLVNKKLVQVADFDTSKDGFSRHAGNGNHNLTVGDVDNDGRDEVICGALALDDDLSVLWCSGRGHGDALHLGDYDPIHEGMEYFSVHEDYAGTTIKGSTTGNDGKQHLGGMTLYDAADGTELFHEDGYGDTGRGMMANVGCTDGYFELWGSGNYASYGADSVVKASYNPDSTNQRIFWDGNLYDELLDGTGGSDSGSQIKISGKDGRISSLRNVVTNNGTKNNPCLIADLFGDWREEVVARGTDNASLVVYTTTIPTEHKLYTLMHDRAYRMQVAAQNAGYNQPPHISYYVSEDNDEYDARKTAAYVSTVHGGETAVRTTNVPDPIYDFDIRFTESGTVIENKTRKQTDAVLYAVKYDDGLIKDIDMRKITISADGCTAEIGADEGDILYLWDTSMRPLAARTTVTAPSQPATPKPITTPTPTPTPTPKPATTSKPSDFTVENGVLTAYSGNGNIVVIPESVNGETITGIAADAFDFNDNVVSIKLPDTVTSIEDGAFVFCDALKSVSLPSGLTEISNRMFRSCEALEDITIPDTVEKIGAEAFYGCSALASLAAPSALKSVGDSAFHGCSSLTDINGFVKAEEIGTNVFNGCSSVTEVSIPQNWTRINDGMFSGTGLASVNLPPQLEEIGADAFSGCPLTEVTLPETVKTLGKGAFSYCSSLEKINLENVVSFGGYGFYYCSSLKSADLTSAAGIGNFEFFCCKALEELTFGSENISIGANAFNSCGAVKKVTIPNTEMTIPVGKNSSLKVYGIIGSQAQMDAHERDIPFYDLETGELAEWAPEFVVEDGVLTQYNGTDTDVVIPESVDGETITWIAQSAFADNSEIVSVDIPDTVTDIDSAAFEYCTALRSVILPDSLTTLNNQTFRGCENLASVSLPKNLQNMYGHVFADCASLTEITIPASLTEIGSGSFLNCCSLERVSFAENSATESIGDYAFQGCTSIKEITLPESVKLLNKSAFLNCSALEKISLENVTDIGNYVFSGCTSLKEVNLGSAQTIGCQAFAESGITSITFPDSVTSVDYYVFENCASLTTVRLSNGMRKLSDIFSGCAALESVYIPSSITTIDAGVFDDCPNVTIYCEFGSYAETYANEHGLAVQN